jgi:hypothetical protein
MNTGLNYLTPHRRFPFLLEGLFTRLFARALLECYLAGSPFWQGCDMLFSVHSWYLPAEALGW